MQNAGKLRGVIWALTLFVLAIGLEALTQSPFLATRFGVLLAFFLRGRSLEDHLYEVSALPAFGFRAAAQTWGETILVIPELLRHSQFTVTMAHEKCHVAQYRRYTSFGFWLLYGWEWLLGLARTRDLFLAYYDISLEKEARAAQSPN